MRALVIADSGPAMADLTRAVVALGGMQLRHANGRTHVTALVRGFAPELVLIDEMHWAPRALARVAEVRRAAPDAAIVVLAEQLEGAWLAEALRMGAAAVMPSGSDEETFRQVLGEVLNRVPLAA